MWGPAVWMRGPRGRRCRIIALQAVEVLVPLARVAERGDAVGELMQRELRVGRAVLDVEVRVDQARQHRPPGEIDVLGAAAAPARWSIGPDRRDAIASTTIRASATGGPPVPSMSRT